MKLQFSEEDLRRLREHVGDVALEEWVMEAALQRLEEETERSVYTSRQAWRAYEGLDEE